MDLYIAFSLATIIFLTYRIIRHRLGEWMLKEIINELGITDEEIIEASESIKRKRIRRQ